MRFEFCVKEGMGSDAPNRVAALAVAIVVASATAFAQNIHTLQGRVSFANGAQPANPVRVTLTFSGKPVYETFTDLSGRFSFSGLSRGMYRLTAETDGQTFETTRVDAEVSGFGSPQTFTQNIQLRSKGGNPPASAAVVSVEESDPNLPVKAREQYQKGLKQARDNKPEKAIKLFEEALTAHPQFYSAYVALAEQYAKVKRDQESAAAYQKAIEIKPDNASAYVGFGVMLVKQKQYAEAIPPLRRSLELDKQSSTPYLFLGLAEMMTGDYQSAEASLLRSYEIGKPALARIYLANLYELKGEPEKAIQQLKSFLDETPNLPDERRAEIRTAIDKLRKRVEGKK
jgi:Tfp pilus assembly protein PilF